MSLDQLAEIENTLFVTPTNVVVPEDAKNLILTTP